MTIVKTATAFHLTFKYRRKVYDDWSLHFIQWLYDKCHGAHALKTGLITGTRGTRGNINMHNTNRYKNPQIQTSHWQPCVTVITGLTTGTTGGIITSAETAQKITALLLRQKKEFEKILYICFPKNDWKTCKNIQWQFELSTQLYTSKAEKQFKHSHGRRLGCLSS